MENKMGQQIEAHAIPEQPTRDAMVQETMVLNLLDRIGTDPASIKSLIESGSLTPRKAIGEKPKDVSAIVQRALGNGRQEMKVNEPVQINPAK